MDRATTHRDISLIPAPERGIWRLGKAKNPIKYEFISEDDAHTAGGNRWSLATHGTLYCASEHEGCFAETLAAFRVDPAMRDLIADDWKEPYYLTPGKIPRDWTTAHTLIRLQPVKEARFLDVDDEATLETLTRELHRELAAHRVGRLTTEHIQGFNHRVTRVIAAWATAQRTGPTHQDGLIQGIAYRSRFGRRRCWALFSGVDFKQEESSLVFPEAEALRTVAEEYGLTML
ncbi:RES family NAD+ phosphorylase [Streptomyces sp. NPDC059999]|uniref:RES family NAD+ phosphorylase n=1 Tax=unclassified Streptomyces TaxID=2593676 RepID=UPI0036AB22D6